MATNTIPIPLRPQLLDDAQSADVACALDAPLSVGAPPRPEHTAAFDTLTHAQQLAVVRALATEDGLNDEDIAFATGWTLATVRSVLGLRA